MSRIKTILVAGANGQVGQEFKALSKKTPEYNFLFADRNGLDITNENAVQAFFEIHKIDVCINCAAYTAVDKAEQEKELAMLVNATAVGYLARASKINNTQFIHISTDYVFDGKATTAYRPSDITNPVNFYGHTKLQGEQNATLENENSIIVRTAWVYSNFGNNFVKTMQRLMATKETIGVVSDQRGAPTYAADLAEAIMQIIISNNFAAGIYHYSNKGNISWYDFATKIALLIKSKCIVNPITTAQFPTAAARPAYSVLDTQKMEETFGIIIPNWEDSLKKCLRVTL